MEGLVPLVLAFWVVLTIGLFWKHPGRDTALFVLVGGRTILPTGVYPGSVFAEPVGSGGSMHALAVPTLLLINKALAIGLGCLVGVVLVDWPAVQRLRPIWLDAPMFCWCLLPIAAVLVNGQHLAAGLAQTRYLALAWGVPYGLGRIYLGGGESLRRLGLSLVLAGLLYVPLGLREFVRGPFLYDLVYGSHPYRFDGAALSLGHRPLVFLEHGNQLGMWIASAAVSAAWLWRSRRLPTIARIPGGFAAAALVAACLAFQSHSAVGLMLAVLVPLILTRWSLPLPKSAYAGIGVVVLLLAVAGTTAVLAAETGGWSELRGKVRDAFREIGKSSFTWRLARAEENLPRVAQRPVLGWSRPDWSIAEDGTFLDPAALGLWLMTLGMFGAVGLACSTATVLLPVGEVIRKLPTSAWTGGPCSAVALTAVLLVINSLDLMLNSVLLLPLLAGAGGINSWSAEIRRARSRPGHERKSDGCER
jgi:hypothetical protein